MRCIPLSRCVDYIGFIRYTLFPICSPTTVTSVLHQFCMCRQQEPAARQQPRSTRLALGVRTRTCFSYRTVHQYYSRAHALLLFMTIIYLFRFWLLFCFALFRLQQKYGVASSKHKALRLLQPLVFRFSIFSSSFFLVLRCHDTNRRKKKSNARSKEKSKKAKTKIGAGK